MKKHWAIDVEDDEGQYWLGACFYTAWANYNIDYQLDYLWNNNTDDIEEVTCKRCLGMMRTGLWSLVDWGEDDWKLVERMKRLDEVRGVKPFRGDVTPLGDENK